MQTYFNRLLASFTSLDFYRSSTLLSLKSSWAYFCCSFVLLGLLWALQFQFVLAPKAEQELQQSLTDIENNFPTDLEINWDGTQLTSTYAELYLDYPSWVSADTSELPKKFLRLTQTDGDSVPSTEGAESSLLVVDPNQLFVSDLRGGWRNTELNTVPGFENPFTLSAATVGEIVTGWHNRLHEELQAAGVAAYLFLPVLLLVWRLVVVLFDSLIIFLVLRLFTLFSYRKVLQRTLYLAVIAGLIERVSSFVYPDSILPMYAIAFWILTLYVFWRVRK